MRLAIRAAASSDFPPPEPKQQLSILIAGRTGSMPHHCAVLNPHPSHPECSGGEVRSRFIGNTLPMKQIFIATRIIALNTSSRAKRNLSLAKQRGFSPSRAAVIKITRHGTRKL
jgi:hypothetical protein